MKKGIKLFTFGLALTIAGGVSSVIIYKVFEKPNTSAINEHNFPEYNQLTSNKVDIVGQPINLEVAAQLSVNAVVHVKTEVLVNRPTDPFYQFFYGGRQQPELAKSSGSGVLISDDGYIVTNNHVIEDAENICNNLKQ